MLVYASVPCVLEDSKNSSVNILIGDCCFFFQKVLFFIENFLSDFVHMLLVVVNKCGFLVFAFFFVFLLRQTHVSQAVLELSVADFES